MPLFVDFDVVIGLVLSIERRNPSSIARSEQAQYLLNPSGHVGGHLTVFHARSFGSVAVVPLRLANQSDNRLIPVRTYTACEMLLP